MVLKKKTFWLMLFILGLGTFLRLIFIDKPDGLWNDEYVSWQIASIPLGKRFWHAVFAQCHMPFYYFYLKFFIHFFGNSDLMLRLTSLPAGILSIISMYFAGKEFKDEKLGILCAAIASLSSFLIYFSQEVRFYGLLFFFSSLVLLFTLKLIKKQTVSNIIFFIIFNLPVIFTHTIGFVFVLLNLLFVTFYLAKNKNFKANLILVWSSIFLLILFASPLLFSIFTSHSAAQWWDSFTISKIGFLITDYFSPILTNIVSAPDKFFYDLSIKFFIFALIPSIIAIAGIVKAIQTKNRELIGLFSVCLFFVAVLVTASMLDKIVFVTKYSIEIYPILILLTGFGLLEFGKNWRYVLIFLFCFLNLFYVLNNPLSAPKLHRSEGHKIVADLLNNAGLKKGDFILINYYGKDRFEKYFDFSNYNVISINKANFAKYLGVNTKKDFQNISDAHFVERFKSEAEDNLKPDQKLAIIVLKDVARYSPVQMDVLKQNEKLYKKTPFFFLVFSYLRNKELDEGLKNLKILRMETKGQWSVITFRGKG